MATAKAVKLQDDTHSIDNAMNILYTKLDEAIDAFRKSTPDKDIAARAYYQIAKVYILKDDEISSVENILGITLSFNTIL